MAVPDVELLAWVLTYLLHSSVLLGAAWFASRALGERRRTREALLVAAALGGLLTSGAQVALGFEPLGGRHDLAAGPRAADGPGSNPVHPSELALALRAEEQRALESASPSPTVPADPFVLAGGAESAPASARMHPETRFPVARATTAPLGLLREAGVAFLDRVRTHAPRLVLLVLALVALARLVPLALGWRALRRELAGAREVRGDALAEQWNELARRAGLRRAPRLLVCPHLDAPLTAGLVRPRVCLPERAARELSPAALRALLAHELAHVERRDPLRALLGSLLERLLWFQPLNRALRRQLEELAEHACDARAVELGVKPIELARCLTDVAGWLVARPRPWSAAPGMAARHSVLGARVRRLVGPGAGPVAEPRAGLVGALALLVVGAVGVAAPGFGAQREAARTSAASTAALAPEPELAPAESFDASPAAPTTPLPANAPPTPTAELEALLALLDEELLLLERELFALRAGQLSDLGGGLLTRPLAEIESRLADLRGRRAHLDRLLPLLMNSAALERAPRPAARGSMPVLPLPSLQSRPGKELH